MPRYADSVSPMNAWWAYVTEKSGSDAAPPIARKLGIDQSTVNRWRTSIPQPERVALFARTYGRPVIEAFVAAGFLTAEEAGQKVEPIVDADVLSDEDLVAQVAKRLARSRDVGEPRELSKDELDRLGHRERLRAPGVTRQRH